LCEVYYSCLLYDEMNRRFTARGTSWSYYVVHLTFKVECPCFRSVLVNRVYRTPQGVPEFSRGVPTWWGVYGCTRCVLFKNSQLFRICSLLQRSVLSFHTF